MEEKKEIILLSVDGQGWDLGVPVDSIVPFLHSIFRRDGNFNSVLIKDIYEIIQR